MEAAVAAAVRMTGTTVEEMVGAVKAAARELKEMVEETLVALEVAGRWRWLRRWRRPHVETSERRWSGSDEVERWRW